MIALLRGHLHPVRFLAAESCYFFSTERFSSDNPYVVLGVKPTDSEKQIKAAYHKLSKAYHPDVNTDPKAADVLKNINNAYDKIKKSDFKQYANTTSRSAQWTHTHHQHSYQQQSTRYEDTNWHEEYQKRQREEAEKREKEKRARQDSKEKAQSSKTKESDEEYEWMTDEDIYYRIFRKTYREDPAFFYKTENQHLRKKYEEIINKKRGADAKGQQSAHHNWNYNNTSSRKTQYEDSAGTSSRSQREESSQQQESLDGVFRGISLVLVGCVMFFFLFQQVDAANYNLYNKCFLLLN